MEHQHQEDAYRLLETWFSTPRMLPYITEVEGCGDCAVDLYVWNAAVTAEFWKIIGYTEVALRNAISNQLKSKWGVGPLAWLDHPEVVKPGSDAYTKIGEAKSNLRKTGKDPSFDRLIAELNFGFWQQLVSKRSRHLWPTISRGLHGANTNNPKRLSESLQMLRLFRNRIAHHYKIWHLDLFDQYRNIVEILEMIDPTLAAWVLRTDTTFELISSRPKCRSQPRE
mgnify:CR=1 FL=1